MEAFIAEHREELERRFFALPDIIKLCMVLPDTPIREWSRTMSTLTGDPRFLKYRAKDGLFEATDTWLMAGGNAFGECEDEREARFWMDDDGTTVRMQAPPLADIPEGMMRCNACGRIWDGFAQCMCPESDVV